MNCLKSARITFLLCTLSSTLTAASFRDDFAVVMIDAATEAKFGAFPLERSFLARGIRKAAALGGNAVVIKFFLDLPRDPTSDLALSSALTNVPVLLQARIDDTEAHPNPFPDRFNFPGVNLQTEMSGRSGWIPLPIFAAKAKDIGFVDSSSTRVPLLETYQSRTVKSLIVCCIEQATGRPARIASNSSMKFGASRLQMDSHNCVTANLPPKDDLAYIPFHQFLEGDIPASQIKGRIVIIGYDGPKMQSFSTTIGQVRGHRLFVYALQSIYEQVRSP